MHASCAAGSAAAACSPAGQDCTLRAVLRSRRGSLNRQSRVGRAGCSARSTPAWILWSVCTVGRSLPQASLLSFRDAVQAVSCCTFESHVHHLGPWQRQHSQCSLLRGAPPAAANCWLLSQAVPMLSSSSSVRTDLRPGAPRVPAGQSHAPQGCPKRTGVPQRWRVLWRAAALLGAVTGTCPSLAVRAHSSESAAAVSASKMPTLQWHDLLRWTESHRMTSALFGLGSIAMEGRHMLASLQTSAEHVGAAAGRPYREHGGILGAGAHVAGVGGNSPTAQVNQDAAQTGPGLTPAPGRP